MIFLEIPFVKFTSNKKFQLSEINKIFKWRNSLNNYDDINKVESQCKHNFET